MKNMKQINIGTCVPGQFAERWLPVMKDKGYECFAINFHMGYYGVDLKALAPKVNEMLADTDTYVSTIGYYCNALENESQLHDLEFAIDNAHLFGAKTVATFAGALEGKDVPSAIPRFKEVYSELARRAEANGVKLAIENCPMGGTWNHNTCNIGFNPDAWEMMFDAVPSDALGLEWEPAHQLIQLIDPIAELRIWAKKIVHMHGKDASVDWEAIRRRGIYRDRFFDTSVPERTPGFGDTNWRDVFSILHENGYEGDVCIEGYHDPIYSGEWEMTGQMHALKYLKFCRGGDFIPNPWDVKANF